MPAKRESPYTLIQADCFAWLRARADGLRRGEVEPFHAVVTDPPYGVVEYTDIEKDKLRKGRGGVWRIPPSLDGYQRSPLPRFTTLSESDLAALVRFFSEWAGLVREVVVPGAHVIVATNPLLSDLLCGALRSAGLEKRGEIVRLVQTLRGGDRPKNAHKEFPNVTVMPRSGWEPWVVFRKPCEGRVQDNLRKHGTGGLRRVSDDLPFLDVIASSPTRPKERALANHPSLKPQAFMRQVVRAALPLGKGMILDPFLGGGSTIAAATAIGYQSVGVEMDREYFKIATEAIPRLVAINANNGAARIPKKAELATLNLF